MLMLEGITAGFIFSLSLFPGTVWLARVGYTGASGQVWAVTAGFWLAQLLWMVFAVPGLMMMARHLAFFSAGMHLFAAFVLLYMSLKYFRTARADALDPGIALPPWQTLFRRAFVQSLAMPMRLPAAMAILLSTGVFINNRADWPVLPGILLGTLIGVSWWWGQTGFLAAFFAQRVPERITLRSLNKIRPFCGLLFLVLAGVVIVLGL